jgi:hypothetical protein
MGSQSQNQGSGNVVDPGRMGARNSHAAGSGSSTGDPGNQRGPQPQGSKPAKDGQPSRQATDGASPDDHVESGSRDSQNH